MTTKNPPTDATLFAFSSTSPTPQTPQTSTPSKKPAWQELPPLTPIPIKERTSLVFVERGQIDVIDGVLVVLDVTGIRMQIPMAGLAALLLEPGTRISHPAVRLAALVGCLLIWVGEAAVRVYAAGQPGGARADRLLYQAKLALDDELRRKVVIKMYEMRFQESVPQRRSVDQLRGIEGTRVRDLYKRFAQKYGVAWKRRLYDPKEWEKADDINRLISVGNSCLYGVTEAAILASGYAPAIGFLHRGKPLAFVYDIADIVKFETVVPLAFQLANRTPHDAERVMRARCRDAFRTHKTLEKLIPLIHEVLAAGGIAVPADAPEGQPPALPELEVGDVGHRG